MSPSSVASRLRMVAHILSPDIVSGRQIYSDTSAHLYTYAHSDTLRLTQLSILIEPHTHTHTHTHNYHVCRAQIGLVVETFRDRIQINKS